MDKNSKLWAKADVNEDDDMLTILFGEEGSEEASYTAVMKVDGAEDFISLFDDGEEELSSNIPAWIKGEKTDFEFETDDSVICQLVDEFATDFTKGAFPREGQKDSFVVDIAERVNLPNDIVINEETYSKGSLFFFYHTCLIRRK